MPPRANAGRGNRQLMNHSNGKGDADRSNRPVFEKSFVEIDWQRSVATDDGFRRVSPSRIRKCYGRGGKHPAPTE